MDNFLSSYTQKIGNNKKLYWFLWYTNNLTFITLMQIILKIVLFIDLNLI